MDPWEHEDWSSFVGSSLLPSRPLRNRYHDQLPTWRTRSWVMLVNGINKYVPEMSDETQENRTDDIGDSTGRLVAKARPTQTPRPTSSSPTVTLPYHHRKWVDVEPGEVRQKLFRSVETDDQIASAIHPTVPREENGAVEFRTLAAMFHSDFTSSP